MLRRGVVHNKFQQRLGNGTYTGGRKVTRIAEVDSVARELFSQVQKRRLTIACHLTRYHVVCFDRGSNVRWKSPHFCRKLILSRTVIQFTGYAVACRYPFANMTRYLLIVVGTFASFIVFVILCVSLHYLNLKRKGEIVDEDYSNDDKFVL